MSIDFNQIPSNIRSPLAYIEVNASNQNSNQPTNKRILVIGQRLSTGTVSANVPTLIASYSQAVSSFGQGSILANMFKTLFDNNQFTEKWCLPLDDDAGGTAATGTIVVTGPATAAGTIYLYMGGVKLSIAVANGDTATIIGASISTAINANLDLPVTSAAVTGTVTVTFRHKGTIGNYYNMQLNYAGALAGESLPAGVGITITQLATGATDPSLTTPLAALPEQIFDYWVCPYQNSTTLTSLDTEMDSRWSGIRMLEGHVFAAAAGTVASLVTLGTGRNSPHMSILDAGNNSPTPSYLWAAAYAGQVASSASIDPARPFTTLPLVDILAEPVQNRRLLADKNTLLYDGISTHNVAQDGTVEIERVITCYQTNSFGVADGVYLDVTTPLTLAALRQDLRGRITSKFARMKLADDGTRFGAGQAIVTPSIIKSEIIAWAKQMSLAGLVEDMEDFKANLIVERNVSDPTRVDVQLTPNLVNPLYIFAASISFIL